MIRDHDENKTNIENTEKVENEEMIENTESNESVERDSSLAVSNRWDYLDAMRLFATLSVITLHATSKQWSRASIDSIDWQILNIYDSIVRFCVPVFFMISGVLFLNPQREFPLKKLYGKNLLRLGTGFFFWSMFYVLVGTWRSGGTLTPLSFLSQSLLGRYHLGFLFTLAGIYLTVPILRRIAHDKETLVYFLCLSFVFVQLATTFQLSPKTGIWLERWQERGNFHLVLGYSGYFLLGYYLHTYPLNPLKQRKGIYVLSILALLGTIVGTHLLSQRDGVANSALYQYHLPNTYVVAIAVFLLFQQMKLPERVEQWVKKVSPLTFGVYLVHDFYLVLFMEDFQWMDLGIPAIISVPIFTTAVFVASLLTVMMLQKIPVLGKWIM